MSETITARHPGRWQLRWAVTRQEIANIARHPYYVVSFAIPIFMSLAFALFVSALGETDELIVAVYDAGNSDWAATVAQWEVVTVQMVASETAVFAALEDKATAGILIPAGFDTAVAAGQSPELLVYVNKEARNDHIATFTRQLSDALWTMGERPPPAVINWQEANVRAAALTFSVEEYIVVIFIILGICMTTMGILAQTIVEKRETGSLPALLASPLSFGDLLWGQSTAVFLYTMLLSAVLLALNGGWVGNVLVTAVSIILTTFSLLGLGLFFGLWSQSKNQCNAYTGVLGIVLVIPSWFALVPPDNLSLPLTAVLRLLPTTYLVELLNQSLNGTATWATVWVNLLVLCLFTAVFFGLVRWRLQRQPVW
ncbi:MAG TPA: ABC transporter permease [Chloroflexota bacterium]|nr:ABC transporter permease [Chloroflexota bacterium]